MNRTFEIHPHGDGWKLTLVEDGVEVGGGVADFDDYSSLAEAGQDFVGPFVLGCHGSSEDAQPSSHSSKVGRTFTLLRTLKERIASHCQEASWLLSKTFQNCIVSILGWLVLKLVNKAGVLKLVYKIHEKLKVAHPDCSIQLALLVSQANSVTFLFDLTHRRVVKFEEPHQFFVKPGDLLRLDQSRFDHPFPRLSFDRVLFRVARAFFK